MRLSRRIEGRNQDGGEIGSDTGQVLKFTSREVFELLKTVPPQEEPQLLEYIKMRENLKRLNSDIDLILKTLVSLQQDHA